MGPVTKEPFILQSVDCLHLVKHLEILYKMITKPSMHADIIRSQSLLAHVFYSVTAHQPSNCKLLNSINKVVPAWGLVFLQIKTQKFINSKPLFKTATVCVTRTVFKSNNTGRPRKQHEIMNNLLLNNSF